MKDIKIRSAIKDSFLEGKTVCLRALTEKDLPRWYRWFNDPEVTEYVSKGLRPNTQEAQRSYFRMLSNSEHDVQMGIALRKNGLFIGIIGIHKINWVHRNGDISIVIGDKEYWGKGIAKEAIALLVRHAFTKMNLNKLSAGMMELNKASKRSFESNGFKVEGRRRRHFFYKGKYVDTYTLGLLRKDWRRLCR